MSKRTCPMKHYCERDSFARKNAYEVGSPAHEHKYEVWDLAANADPEWDDPDTNENMVFSSDDKSECERFIGGRHGRLELRENGVCKVCDMYDRRQADLKCGKVRPFYLVVEGTSRLYGGPEEGGWYYDWHEILEVRKAYTLEQGLAHARTLKETYPQPRFNRFSCANRGEPDTRIVFCYGEDDPRWPTETKQAPRYE